MQEQLYNILERLIVKNNIKINREELKLQLSSHPSYPSLHAITGVLGHFNIPNLALKLSVSEDILNQLPHCFIANVSTEFGDAIVFVEKKKESIRLVFDSKKIENLSNKDFLKRWNGIIVAIEKDENILEEKKGVLYKLPILALYVLSLTFVTYFYYASNSAFMQWHFALSIFGLIASVFIVKHELGLQSNIANSFCNLSSKTSCDAVLESKGALLFGMFKLSDVSIVSFATYCLCWLALFSLQMTNFNALAIVSLLSFPFVVYSVYYQSHRIKKWCPWCLSIAAILVLQIGASLFFSDLFSEALLDVKSIAIIIASALLSLGLWSVFKPLITKKKELEILKVEHYRFKRDFSLFNALFKQSETLEVENYFPNELVFGNEDAEIELTLVTSPLCFYCKKAHSDIEHLLKKLEGKIKLIIRFNVDVSNKEGHLYRIATRILDIYNTNGEYAALAALNEVYSEDIDFDKWLQNQPKPSKATFDYTLKEQHTWCLLNDINFTPALYINNRQFPQEYRRLDLTYFIDDLIEAKLTANSHLIESNYTP